MKLAPGWQSRAAAAKRVPTDRIAMKQLTDVLDISAYNSMKH